MHENMASEIISWERAGLICIVNARGFFSLCSMARKSSEEKPGSRGMHDVIGLVLLASSILVFVSLLTYDRLDLASKTTQPNVPPHNYIGTVGAHAADTFFFIFGAAAYLIPALAFFVGLG